MNDGRLRPRGMLAAGLAFWCVNAIVFTLLLRTALADETIPGRWGWMVFSVFWVIASLYRGGNRLVALRQGAYRGGALDYYQC